jgi:hypothetical protein
MKPELSSETKHLIESVPPGCTTAIDREQLARRVADVFQSAFTKLAEHKDDIEELRNEFAQLDKGETIMECRNWTEFCQNVLKRSIRAVQYMLTGGNPVSKRKARETVSRPILGIHKVKPTTKNKKEIEMSTSTKNKAKPNPIFPTVHPSIVILRRQVIEKEHEIRAKQQEIEEMQKRVDELENVLQDFEDLLKGQTNNKIAKLAGELAGDYTEQEIREAAKEITHTGTTDYTEQQLREWIVRRLDEQHKAKTDPLLSASA